MERIIFFNIAWMENYQGITETDKPINGGSYVKEHQSGHEIYNFKRDRDGRFYGYVQPARSGDIHLERIIGKKEIEELSNITVIWTARQPGNGRVIVGWYRNARVFSSWQEPINKTMRKNGRDLFGYYASARKAVLLPSGERTFSVPSGRGYFGQSNVWFADSNRGFKYRDKVLKYLNVSELGDIPKVPQLPANRKKSGGRYQQDPLLRLKVEEKAMRFTANWFKKEGFQVRDVSRDCIGWDLEARRKKELLKLEVKGISGASIQFELTPNELLQAELYLGGYKFCVITNALKIRPNFHLFTYLENRSGWVDQFGKRKLKLIRKVGAIAKG